jgi:hypothetical protein
MEKKIEQYILALPPEKRELVLLVREIFLGTSPLVTEALKWGNPTFIYKGKNFAFAYTYKTTVYVNVGFANATALSDPKQLFEGTGKGMRHIKVATKKDIPAAQLKKWIKETMQLYDTST